MAHAPLSLYLHIPFCKQKCQYCDFPSFAGCESRFEEYAAVLEAEMNLTADLCRDYEIPSVFFGGGTPTILPAKLLGRLMDLLTQKYNLTDDAEITMEANPGTLSPRMLEEIQSMGVNRLSMGVQARQNRLLRRLGRIHTWEEFLQNYTDARRLGFENINLDLMFGLPDQTLADWTATLDAATTLAPAHISAYSLIVEEGTPFFEEQQEGRLRLPSENIDRRMYTLTRELLARFGYHQYEISNFAREGRECYHNKVYWTCGEYLGLGLAAHSYVGGERFHNTAELEKYLAARGEKRRMVEDVETLTRAEKMSEFCFMGLRMTKGVEFAEFENRFGVTMESVYSGAIQKLKKQGLLRRTAEGVALTPRGMDLANQAFAEFVLEELESF